MRASELMRLRALLEHFRTNDELGLVAKLISDDRQGLQGLGAFALSECLGEVAMITLTMRVVKGDFIINGPDIAPMKFKSRPEARDWCKHPGSPITEIGPGGKRAAAKKPPERPSR